MVAALGLSMATIARAVGSPVAIATDVAVGWLLLACGIVLWRTRTGTARSGAWLALTGVAWLAGGVLHRGPLAQVLLTWPSGRLANRATAGVVAFIYVDGFVESVARQDAFTLVYCAALGITGGLRVVQSSGMVRRSRLIAGIGAVAVAAVVAADRIAILAGTQGTGSLALMVYDGLIATLAVALTLDARSGSWSRSAVTGVVVELGQRAVVDSLRDRLAGVLGDQTLIVGYATVSGAFADEAGRQVLMPRPGSGRRATRILDGNAEVAVIVHDAAVLDDPALVDAVASATRVAVANRQLRAEIDDRVRAIDASQRRLLSTADDQRRRLERQLDAGALARLGRVRVLIEDPGVDGAIADSPVNLLSEIVAAERDLSAFANGVYPGTLTSEGLAAAVEALARTAPLVVAVRLPRARLATDVEAAAYFVCAEGVANAVKYARATQIDIDGEVVDDRLTLRIADNGIGGADPVGSGLQGLHDRVVALAGTFVVRSPTGGGTTLEAIIPPPAPARELPLRPTVNPPVARTEERASAPD